MPCEKCEEGKYKWGETGDCMYETLEDCQLANQGEYLEEELKPSYNNEDDVDHTYTFDKKQMKELHEDGELIVHIEEEGQEMTIKFIYDKEEREEREEELEEDIDEDKKEIEEEVYAKSRLNSKGYDYATTLVEGDNINKDSDWSFSTEDGNALLGEDGDDWENYAKWFLLENEDASEETKDRYKFPFGKDGKIYRSALSAIRQRSGQFGYDDVFEAAGKLIEMIEKEDEDELESAYSKLTKSMLDDELDEYIDRITSAIKKL